MQSRSALVLDPDELEALYQCLVMHDAIACDHDTFLLVEERWPELTEKILPPKERLH